MCTQGRENANYRFIKASWRKFQKEMRKNLKPGEIGVISSDSDSDEDGRSHQQSIDECVKQEVNDSDKSDAKQHSLNNEAVPIDEADSRTAVSTVNDCSSDPNLSNGNTIQRGHKNLNGAPSASLNDTNTFSIGKLVSAASPEQSKCGVDEYDDILSEEDEYFSDTSTIDFEDHNRNKLEVKKQRFTSKIDECSHTSQKISANPPAVPSPPRQSFQTNSLDKTKCDISYDSSAKSSPSNFSPSYGSAPSLIPSIPSDCMRTKRPVLPQFKSNLTKINLLKDPYKCPSTGDGNGQASALNSKKSVDKSTITATVHQVPSRSNSKSPKDSAISKICAIESVRSLWDPAKFAEPLGGSKKAANGASQQAVSQLSPKYVSVRKNATPLTGHDTISSSSACSTSSIDKTKIPEERKPCGSSSAMTSKSSSHSTDVVQSKSKPHDVSKSNNATDGALPSTSKHRSSNTNLMIEIDREAAICKHVRALNRSLSKSDARRLTKDFIRRIQNYSKQTKSSGKESDKKANGMSNHKRRRDSDRGTADSTAKSTGSVNKPDPKRRRKSMFSSIMIDNGSTESAASPTNSSNIQPSTSVASTSKWITSGKYSWISLQTVCIAVARTMCLILDVSFELSILFAKELIG